MNIRGRWLLFAVTALWVGVHVVYGDVLIVHDSWKHIFPIVYAVAKNATCGSLPAWLSTVDNGSPTLLYLISFSLTQITRIPLLYVWSCVHPDVVTAMYAYKLQIYLAYFLFGASMYVLGRVLFEHRFSAIYLFAATLFAGLCLDSAHSNQVVSMIFWVPWMLIAGVLYHRNAQTRRRIWYLNAGMLFLCIQILDQYPHFIILVAIVALVLYACLSPSAFYVTLPNLPRLWPALILLFITATQLLVIKHTIVDYAPSLRSALVVDPRVFGETGFVQPSALIGSFLPLTFMTGFDTFGDSMATVLQSVFHAPMGRKFIFRLDVLLFYVGVVPTLLVIVFALLPGSRGLKRGWLLFAAICFLISLQQSRLYRLLYHVPFFDVFRSYFLYIVFVVFAVLVMSAYGLDYILKVKSEERTTIAKHAILCFALLCSVSALVLVGLTFCSSNPVDLASTLGRPLLMDLALIMVGIMAFWKFIRSERTGIATVALLGGMLLPQLVYISTSYDMVGATASEVYGKFGLDEKDSLPVEPARFNANSDRRKLCTAFAQCYLSYADTVSLNRDLQGTFLRNRDEPVFHTDLRRPIVEVLTGITHPVFWISRRLHTFSDDDELARILNSHENDTTALLSNITYVAARDIARLPREPSATEFTVARILSGVRGKDSFALDYVADTPVYVNAAVNYDPYWHALVNGKRIPVAKANFGGIVAAVPAGRHTIKFEYKNPYHEYLLLSRYALLAIALVLAIRLCVLLLPRAHRT